MQLLVLLKFVLQIVAWITIFASTLDMLADVIFCCWSLLPRLLEMEEGTGFKTNAGKCVCF